MNVVATRATRRIVDRMMADSLRHGGPEAARRNLADVEPGQLAALVGLLLKPPRQGSETRGRPTVPLTLSDEAMRRGYSQYRQGIRNDFTITAMREYTRANKRAERQRKAS